MGIVSDGLQHRRSADPKRVIAVADYGQYGHLTETVYEDGQRREKSIERTPDDERAVWMPDMLRRAIVCRATEWKVKPRDLDEDDLGWEIEQSLYVLTVFDAFRQYASDIERMTPHQMEIVDDIERMRDRLKKADRP